MAESRTPGIGTGHRAFASNVGALLGEQAIGTVARTVASLIVIRHLGAHQYGAYAVVVGSAAIAMKMASAGLDMMAVRDMARAPNRASRLSVWREGLRVRIAAAAVGSAIVLAIGGLWLTDVDFILWLVGAVVVLPLPMVSLGLVFQSEAREQQAAAARVLLSLMIAAGQVIAVATSQELWVFVLLYGTSPIGLAFIYVLLLRRGLLEARSRPLVGVPRRSLELLRESWPMALSAAAVMVYMRVDQLMIADLAGTRSAGIYSAAVKIAEVTYILPTLAIRSIFPAMSRALDRQASPDILVGSFRLAIALGLVVPLLITVLSSALPIVLGEGYSDSVPVLKIYAWSIMPVAIALVRDRSLVARGQQKAIAIATVSGAVINVAMNMFLIPPWGATGAAAATITSYSMATVGIMAVSRRYTVERKAIWHALRRLHHLREALRYIAIEAGAKGNNGSPESSPQATSRDM